MLSVGEGVGVYDNCQECRCAHGGLTLQESVSGYMLNWVSNCTSPIHYTRLFNYENNNNYCYYHLKNKDYRDGGKKKKLQKN